MTSHKERGKEVFHEESGEFEKPLLGNRLPGIIFWGSIPPMFGGLLASFQIIGLNLIEQAGFFIVGGTDVENATYTPPSVGKPGFHPVDQLHIDHLGGFDLGHTELAMR